MAARDRNVGAVTAVALAFVAFGCKREGERPAQGSQGGGPGAALVTLPVTSDASTASPTLANVVCPPRQLGRDPGPTKVSAYSPAGPPGDVADVKDRCVRHADCSQYPHGRCVHEAEREVHPFGQRRIIPAHNECIYDECTSDDECRRTSTHEPRAEQVCNCSPERNTCSFANCRADSDCPSPFPCGPWRYCHSAADKCRTNADCRAGDGCVYSWSVKHYICETETHIAPD